MTDTRYRTDQEAFWAGEFGDEYIERNRSEALLASNVEYFRKALAKAGELRDCIEFGANIGMNVKALAALFPNLNQHAVEINEQAASRLRELLPADNVHHASILDFEPPQTCDLSFVKGVLIHINPDMLPLVYDKLYAASSRFILIGEYYSPKPTSIDYRGHSDKLFKRDFAGEMLDRHPDLTLVDYGFAYHRDPAHPQDDITWFLMRK